MTIIFYQPVRNKQEAYEKLAKVARNDDFTTGNLLDYSCYQNYYKLGGIDLSRETNAGILQQINVIGKIGEAEKQQKTILNLSLGSLIITK